MRVEIINTGTELLLGQVNNTHLAFLAQSLFGLGLRVERQVTVPDGVAIAEAFEDALGRGADLILVTGGLGSTSDDITREAASEAFGKKLIFHPEILDGIAAKFAARKFAMNDLQRAQAMVPEGGVVLENKFGTAPGLVVANDKHTAILLPGPPRELRPMWENEALPWLRKNFAARLAPVHEVTLRTLGVGETRVQILLEKDLRELGPVEIGYCARPGEVDLRLIAEDPDLLKRAAGLARSRLKDLVYTEDGAELEEVVVRLALAANKTIATAESCTAGLVAAKLTNVPGSSGIFRYGWVTYHSEAKTRELGVPPELLEKFGAVSAEVAAAMSQGALRESGADIAVSVTGIAGPGGGTEEKPVGLVWFGLATKGGEVQTQQHHLSRERDTFREMAAQVALDLVRRALLKNA
jgi:nicotinamide-nucleotide amidase